VALCGVRTSVRMWNGGFFGTDGSMSPSWQQGRALSRQKMTVMVVLMRTPLEGATSSGRGLHDGFRQLAGTLMQVSEQLRCLGVQITIHSCHVQGCGEQAEVAPESWCQSHDDAAKDLLNHLNSGCVGVGAHINHRRLLV
jgi:hypothetical protein